MLISRQANLRLNIDRKRKRLNLDRNRKRLTIIQRVNNRSESV